MAILPCLGSETWGTQIFNRLLPKGGNAAGAQDCSIHGFNPCPGYWVSLDFHRDYFKIAANRKAALDMRLLQIL